MILRKLAFPSVTSNFIIIKIDTFKLNLPISLVAHSPPKFVLAFVSVSYVLLYRQTVSVLEPGVVDGWYM